MIEIVSKGDFHKTLDFLHKLGRGEPFSDFHRYGEIGVIALSRATPVDTGLTSQSWSYRVLGDIRHPSIEWFNTNPAGDTSVAILLQYGHGTGTGGYVQGYDYINPAMRPVFDQIANNVWEKVRNG